MQLQKLMNLYFSKDRGFLNLHCTQISWDLLSVTRGDKGMTRPIVGTCKWIPVKAKTLINESSENLLLGLSILYTLQKTAGSCILLLINYLFMVSYESLLGIHLVV